MKIQGSYSFKADVKTTWDTLLSTEIMAACIPGCQSLTPLGDDTYEAVLNIGVASIKGTYRGRVSLMDMEPPRSYKIVFEGAGGSDFVKGYVTLRLSESAGPITQVTLEGDAEVGGVLARVGQRLLGTASRMLINQFFNCLKKKLAGSTP